MRFFAEASFLVAAFAPDEHTAKAWRWWHRWDSVLWTSRLALFEAENTIRVMPLSGKCKPAESRWGIEKMKRAILEGLIVVREVPVRRLYPAAVRLSQHHCTTAGYGAMDIIHVAAALDMRADVLLTFDHQQGTLAKAEGLRVMP